MKTFVTVAICVALAAATAHAGTITDPASGALKLKLLVNADKSCYLVNVSAATLSWDGYQIISDSNILDPTRNEGADTGWKSIADYLANGEYTLVGNTLGSGAFSSGEANPTTHQVAEVNQSASSSQAAGAQWYIGKAVSVMPPTTSAVPSPASGLQFYYSMPGTVGSDFLGMIEVVPEPASIVLLVLGGVGLLVRKRR